jgi:hypothetical protein
MESWKDEGKVGEYLTRVGRLEARRAGEAELVETLPRGVDRVLDLGCADERAPAPCAGMTPAPRISLASWLPVGRAGGTSDRVEE